MSWESLVARRRRSLASQFGKAGCRAIPRPLTLDGVSISLSLSLSLSLSEDDAVCFWMIGSTAPTSGRMLRVHSNTSNYAVCGSRLIQALPSSLQSKEEKVVS